jgi:hypothetical protein
LSCLPGKFACRILIQSFGYALPVSITVPVVISLLITFCGLRNGDPCYFSGTVPDYLFFESPPYYVLEEYLTVEVKGHFYYRTSASLYVRFIIGLFEVVFILKKKSLVEFYVI